MRLLSVMLMGPKCHHKGSYKRETKGSKGDTQKTKGCEDGTERDMGTKPRSANICRKLEETRDGFYPSAP